MLSAAVVLTVGCTNPASSTADTGMAAAANTAPAFDKAAAEHEMRAGDSAYFAAVKAKNADAIAATYSMNAVSMPAGSPPVKGRDAIKKFNEEFLKLPKLEMTGETEDIDFSDDGTMAYATGKYKATWADAKGKTITDEGKYLNVFKKVGGKWELVVDAFSGNAPPQM
jgi:uncharacterized protein (TIGR02246 family)